jgi:hypothetical protein
VESFSCVTNNNNKLSVGSFSGEGKFIISVAVTRDFMSLIIFASTLPKWIKSLPSPDELPFIKSCSFIGSNPTNSYGSGSH